MIHEARPGDVGAIADLYERSYVEPEMTGRGIGSALLDRAKELRPSGFSSWTFQQNEGARRFYERHGLHVIRLTDGEDNEEKTPAALYAWRMADVSCR